jgi:hypothetical protein
MKIQTCKNYALACNQPGKNDVVACSVIEISKPPVKLRNLFVSDLKKSARRANQFLCLGGSVKIKYHFKSAMVTCLKEVPAFAGMTVNFVLMSFRRIRLLQNECSRGVGHRAVTNIVESDVLHSA